MGGPRRRRTPGWRILGDVRQGCTPGLGQNLQVWAQCARARSREREMPVDPLQGCQHRLPVNVYGAVVDGVTPAGSVSRIQVCVRPSRSEEHTSELQSLMRISYAVFCLK